MRTKEEIIEKMIEAMPFRFSNSTKPYVLEAMEIYSQEQVKNCSIPTVSNWVAVSEQTPICYKTGDWDGKMSDLCLCQDEKGDYHLVHCYEYYDGQIEWYDKDDFGLRHEVVKWKAIE